MDGWAWLPELQDMREAERERLDWRRFDERKFDTPDSSDAWRPRDANACATVDLGHRHG